MTNADIALARRFWMHVHEGGTLTTLDVGRMVTAMEEQDAAFTNLHREYDRRGDRIEELEAKLATIVAIVRSHDTGDMQREDMEVRRILQRIEAELTGGKDE